MERCKEPDDEADHMTLDFFSTSIPKGPTCLCFDESMANRLSANVYVFLRGYATQINIYQQFIVAPFKAAELDDHRVIADLIGSRLTAHDVRPRIRCLFLQGQWPDGSSWYAMVDMDNLDDRSIYLLWSTLLKIPVWIGHDLAVECAWIISSGWVDSNLHIDDLPVLLDLQLMVMVFRPLTFYLLHKKAARIQQEHGNHNDDPGSNAVQDAAILDEFSAPPQEVVSGDGAGAGVSPTSPVRARSAVIQHSDPVFKRLAQSTDGNPQHSMRFSLEDLYLTVHGHNLIVPEVNNAVKKYGIAWALPDILPEYIESAFMIINFMRDILFNISTSGLLDKHNTLKISERYISKCLNVSVQNISNETEKSREVLSSIIRIMPVFQKIASSL